MSRGIILIYRFARTKNSSSAEGEAKSSLRDEEEGTQKEETEEPWSHKEMKGETFKRSAEHKCQASGDNAYEGRERHGDGETERLPGGRYSTAQSTTTGRKRDYVKRSKRVRRAYDPNETSETWATSDFWDSRDDCVKHEHPESGCQEQQTGLETYWRQSVLALTLNKAISTSLKHGC